MTSLVNMPDTEQGLREYIRYARKELKAMERRREKLKEDVGYCQNQLMIKGFHTEKELDHAAHV